MINFNPISKQEFLGDYWQKKPFVFRNAMTNFNQPLSADEIAGLSMEDEVESKLVTHEPESTLQWKLKKGPFTESDLTSLPDSHWTLLIQGVDRFIPEVNALLDNFDFLPQWRVDDVMISVAGIHGGVGPHFDNYDVFLYQANGQRKWCLTTKGCHEANAIEGLDLRIMKEFEAEVEVTLEAGDMLYIPPHVGHRGQSLTKNSISYSFGYRSYQAQELWDSFGDYMSENNLLNKLYTDPNWNQQNFPGNVSDDACQQAKDLLLQSLDDDNNIRLWFSRFATQLDSQASALVAEPLEEPEAGSLSDFFDKLEVSGGLTRDINSRIAFCEHGQGLNLFVNGYAFNVGEATQEFIKLIASRRSLAIEAISPYLTDKANQALLYDLYINQTLHL